MAKVLIDRFGFSFVRQKGSHIKLRRYAGGRTITTIVPDHRELDYGTVRGVLRLARVTEEDFWKSL